MKCLFCSYIQEELISRIKQVIEIYDEIPSLYFIITEVLSNCYCDKTGWKLYGGRCDESEMITEEDYIKFLIENGFIESDDPINDPKKQYVDPIKQHIEQHIEETKIQRKRNRDKKYKKQLKKIWIYGNKYLASAFPCNKQGSYTEEDAEDFVRYKRVYNPRRAKFLKRLCNKKVRRGKDIPSRGGYRKYSDYSWMLW